ncbi:MAG: GNAT family N-acetyltransferase [Clostridia bacterium]|nr:GNAT family N-acetyltransferase [Clostridia bacterium]MBQ7549355.1 GNAT family N-acetyltransferase [Clostridia bacterium]
MDYSEPKIRASFATDAGDIRDICEFSLGYPCESALVKYRLEQLNREEEIVLVAEVDGRVVGFVHGEKYRCLYYETALNILGLAVLPDYQKCGIGSKLMMAIEMWANDNSIRIIRLNSGAHRTEAHTFYRNIGYVNEKMQLRFLKEI